MGGKKKKKEGGKRKLVGVISLLVLQFPNTVYAHTTNIYLISDDTTRRRQDPEIFKKISIRIDTFDGA